MPNYRCVESITVGDVVKPLMQVDVNNITIPSYVYQATSFTRGEMWNGGTKPSWILDDGTTFYHNTANNINAQEVTVLDNQYFNLKCPSGQFINPLQLVANGLSIYDYYTQDYVPYADARWGLAQEAFTSSESYRDYHFAIVIDDDNSRGYILIYAQNFNIYGSFSYVVFAYGGIEQNIDYIFECYGAPPITYNWQSVPSISGKNGILSLAQIKDEYINDGESVSGASADYFTNLSTENRVDVLIDAALPAPEIGGTTVTVKYTIPSLSTGSYEYCKLVAKKNSIPEGPEDGDKIINIDPSLTSIVVRGFDELSTYYFIIFIEDDQGNTASSEPKDCVTGRDEGKIFDISATNQLKDSVNNKSPQVIYGSMGTYDSNTQSYYFSSGCYLGYDSRITKTQIQRATKIKIESVVKTDSTVVGASVDTEVGISTSASSMYSFDYAIDGIVCNGIESSGNKHIAKLNYEDYTLQGDAPEDISSNQGGFHTIIHEFTLSSGTVTKIKVTIDGTQFAEASPDVALSLSNDDYYFVVGVCDKTNVKSVKVVIG